MKKDLATLAKAILYLRYVIEQMEETGFEFDIEIELEKIVERNEQP